MIFQRYGSAKQRIGNHYIVQSTITKKEPGDRQMLGKWEAGSEE